MSESPSPLVTIGLPFYNSASTLSSALRSVLCQTFTDWELILINDGSDDAGPDIARSITDPRVTFIDGAMNLGLIHRLNQITELARGEYLARMDADDLMHPERLARQMEVLRSRPEVDLVDTASFAMDNESNLLGLNPQRSADKPVMRLMFTMLNHPTVAGKTAWFRSHPYDGRYLRAEDAEVFVRAWSSSIYVTINQPLYFKREDASVIPETKYSQSMATHILILREYGPQRIGRARTWLLISFVRAKRLLYSALRLIGRPDLVNRFRYRRASSDELAEGNGVLERILGN